MDMTAKKPKIEFSMLAIWTVIFAAGSFFLNPLVYNEKTPQIIVLCYSVIGTLFLGGCMISWFEWIVWWLKNKKRP
jgi:hypothetical protein